MKGPRPWHPVGTWRWAPARRGEGPLCQSTSRAHTLPGLPWGHGQEGWGAGTRLPNTPNSQQVLGESGAGRRDWGPSGETVTHLHSRDP